MNARLTRQLACLQARLTFLESHSSTLIDLDDMTKLKTLRVNVDEFLEENIRNGEVPADPSTHVLTEIAKVTELLEAASVLYNRHLSIGSWLFTTESFPMPLAQFESGVTEIEREFREQNAEISSLMEKCDGVYWAGGDILPDFLEFTTLACPDSVLHRLPRVELREFWEGTGKFTENVSHHVAEIWERIVFLRDQHKTSKPRWREAAALACDGDYLQAKRLLDTGENPVTDADFEAAISAIKAWEKKVDVWCMTDIETQLDKLMSTRLPLWLPSMIRKRRERLNLCQAWQRWIENIESKLLSFNKSDASVTIRDRLQVKRGKLELSRGKTGRETRKQCVNFGLLTMACGLFTWFAVIFPCHLWALSRTTVHFRFQANGKPWQPDAELSALWNGQPISSGGTVKPGNGILCIAIPRFDPVSLKAQVRYGFSNDFGALSLTRSMGSLEIISEPSSAKFILTGEEIGKREGTTPETITNLPTGSYSLLIRHNDWELPGTINIESKKAARYVADFAYGTVEVTSTPSGATVQLDGKDVGKTPTVLERIKPGVHYLAVSVKDWVQEATVDLQPRQKLTQSFEFKYGSAEIDSTPSGASVLFDGRDVGKTPLLLEALKPGQYKVSATHNGWEKSTMVTIGPAKRTKQGFEFDYGELNVDSKPQGATVLVNGRDSGKTPLSLKEIKPGIVTVELNLKGYVSQTVKGEIKENQQLPFTVQLYPLIRPADASKDGSVHLFPSLNSAAAYQNSLGMRFVRTPGTRALFSVFETRVQDYDAFLKATGEKYNPPTFKQGPDHPVVKSPKEASAFCDWLTKKERDEGRIQKNDMYRLPTDSEWSMAAGLREEGKTPEERQGYSWSKLPKNDRWPPPKGTGNFTGKEVDDFQFTAPIGSFQPNTNGLYDMLGNVAEICIDDSSEKQDAFVTRGESFEDASPISQSLVRRNKRGAVAQRTLGFRCVLVPGQ